MTYHFESTDIYWVSFWRQDCSLTEERIVPLLKIELRPYWKQNCGFTEDRIVTLLKAELCPYWRQNCGLTDDRIVSLPKTELYLYWRKNCGLTKDRIVVFHNNIWSYIWPEAVYIWCIPILSNSNLYSFQEIFEKQLKSIAGTRLSKSIHQLTVYHTFLHCFVFSA